MRTDGNPCLYVLFQILQRELSEEVLLKIKILPTVVLLVCVCLSGLMIGGLCLLCAIKNDSAQAQGLHYSESEQHAPAYMPRERHQANGVEECLELTRPIMRRGAGFNIHQVTRQLPRECKYVAPLELRSEKRRCPPHRLSRTIVVVACMFGSSESRGP
jgi:hypothetical protein